MELSPQETSLLLFIKKRDEVNEKDISLDNLSVENVRGAISWLEKKGLIDVRTVETEEFSLSDEGKTYFSVGLPELRVYNLLKKEGAARIEHIRDLLGDKEFKIAISQLAKLGMKPVNGEIKLSGKDIAGEIILKGQEILISIEKGHSLVSEENRDIMDSILKRSGIVERKIRKSRIIKINEKGLEVVGNLNVSTDSIGELTQEMLRDGTWEGRKFRAYDLNLPGKNIRRHGKHPLTELIDEVRKIFLSMGFNELKDPYIEFAGWNMDALFIPQDHPARDMQDTFFLESGNKLEPSARDAALFRRAGKIHEKGSKNYSGWGYKWDQKEAERILLRTHTTGSTMRALSRTSREEKAVFSVDRVFRHESVDWKHLAEFHQVEGAIHARDANLGTLKWYLKKFYSALGFDHIELVPSYYPYTEPSLDVVVYVNGKELEMGGSGVVRPEVTSILGLKHNVIAWGLGLERLALLYYGLDDLRKLYESDLNWLQNYRIRF
ncbi:MAG: phenylalanine--tRNA ligase subunit alpha [Cuniculiplasma sp.]